MIRTAIQVSVRSAVAAGLAVATAQVLRLEFPLYALIAAILVTDLSPARTRQLGAPRLAGTIVGAALGAALSYLGAIHKIGAILIGAGVFAAIFLSHVTGMKDSAKLAGYVCGIVLLTHSDRPWSYAAYRVIETALGIGAGVAVSLVPRLLKLEELNPIGFEQPKPRNGLLRQIARDFLQLPSTFLRTKVDLDLSVTTTKMDVSNPAAGEALDRLIAGKRTIWLWPGEFSEAWKRVAARSCGGPTSLRHDPGLQRFKSSTGTDF
jgi:Fusaric acid resistance protein-like